MLKAKANKKVYGLDTFDESRFDKTLKAKMSMRLKRVNQVRRYKRN